MAADKGHVFAHAGPTHLPAIDWSYVPHRRSVAATLVRASYVLEFDRQNDRQGPEALAPPWWRFFHFELIDQLLDDNDSSIFGAIFQYKPPSTGCKHYMAQDTPKYVIAFRGTILKEKSGDRDVQLDLGIILNCLERTSRVDIAMETVQQFVSARGSTGIWIAGHSLGSAVGMYVGKHMAKDYGVLLETYLFNPPFSSPSLEWIKSKRVKHAVGLARSLIKAGLAKAARRLHRHSKKADDSFDALSGWVPYLFVHSTDPICSGYICYFEQREAMVIKGLEHIERIAMKVSRTSLILYSAGNDSEPLHLLPSASLTKNLSRPERCNSSHELDQWWRADLHLQSNKYQA